MKIYIAAKFERRETLRPIRDKLWEAGHEIIGSWLDEVKRPEGMDTSTFFKKLAIKDLAEIRAADLLILDTTPSDHGVIQGANVEYGFALGQHQSKQVWVIGETTCVFHHIADRHFKSWDECVEVLCARS